MIKRKPAKASHRIPSDSGLNAYLAQIGRYDLLSAEEERALAETLWRQREAYWRALLSYPLHVEPILRAVLGRFGGNPRQQKEIGVAETALRAAVVAARAVRDYDRKANRERLSDAIGVAVKATLPLDPECELADVLAADVRALDTGGKPKVLDAPPPRVGTSVFRQHAAAVAEARAAFVRTRDRFIRANLRLVVKIASDYRASLQDLIQEGNLALSIAVCRFDPKRGYRFSTYASWWILHRVRRWISNKEHTIRLPVHVHALRHKVLRSERVFETEHGREPTDAELAAIVEAPPGKVAEARAAKVQVSSFDCMTTPDAILPPRIDGIEDDIDAERLAVAVADLPGRYREILAARASGLTLKEVGEQHGLSRERVRQLQVDAVGLLRERLGVGQ